MPHLNTPFTTGIRNDLFILVALLGAGATATAQEAVSPAPKSVPKWQVVPLPDQQIAVERNELEVARFHFGTANPRPFLFPLIGPGGHRLTRMGHPHDPHGHRHHNSVWISHHNVNGVDFWGDQGKGKIITRRVVELADGQAGARIVVFNEWLDDTDRGLLEEQRTMRFVELPAGEWFLHLELKLTPKTDPVTLGQTPFGPIGVRMAKTIGVHDGGGRILNSAGARNEKEVFWQPAQWVDYAGPVTDSVSAGITLMDHPNNPGHPAIFHVRDDGWMGASLTQRGPLKIERAQPLILRYGLSIHAGTPSVEEIAAKYAKYLENN